MCKGAAELAYKGQKEDALMIYQRALRMKPNAPEIKNAIKAITSSISDNITASKTMKLFTTMKTLAHKKKVQLQKKLEEEKGMALKDMSTEEQTTFKKACARAVILGKSNLTFSANDMDNCRYTKAQYRSTVVLEVMKDVECSEAYSEQEKQNVTANLHSLEGNACLELGLMDKALDAHNKDLAIGQDHGLLECRSRGMMNIGRVHARAGRFLDAIDVWNDRLPLCVSAAERVWVFHEMGRCYYQMNEFADAQEFANKSCVNAQETSDSRMQFQATFLLAQCYDKLQAMEEALIEYTKALDMALVCDNEHDIPKIEDAIQRLNATITDKIITTRNMEQMCSTSFC